MASTNFVSESYLKKNTLREQIIALDAKVYYYDLLNPQVYVLLHGDTTGQVYVYGTDESGSSPQAITGSYDTGRNVTEYNGTFVTWTFPPMSIVVTTQDNLTTTIDNDKIIAVQQTNLIKELITWKSTTTIATTIGSVTTILKSNITAMTGSAVDPVISDYVFDSSGTIGIITSVSSTSIVVDTITAVGSISSSGLNEYKTSTTLKNEINDETSVAVNTLTKIAGPNTNNSVGDIIYDSVGTLGIITESGTTTIKVITIGYSGKDSVISLTANLALSDPLLPSINIWMRGNTLGLYYVFCLDSSTMSNVQAIVGTYDSSRDVTIYDGGTVTWTFAPIALLITEQDDITGGVDYTKILKYKELDLIKELKTWKTTASLSTTIQQETTILNSTLTPLVGSSTQVVRGDYIVDSAGTIGIVKRLGTGTYDVGTLTIVGSSSGGGLNQYGTTATLSTEINNTTSVAVSTLTKIAGPNANNSVGDLVFDPNGTMGIITTAGTTNVTVRTYNFSGVAYKNSTLSGTGTSSSTQLSVVSAPKLTTARNINCAAVNVSAGSAGSTVSFNGEGDITIPAPGVTGQLNIANGGTGASSAWAANQNLYLRLWHTNTVMLRIVNGAAPNQFGEFLLDMQYSGGHLLKFVYSTGTSTIPGEQVYGTIIMLSGRDITAGFDAGYEPQWKVDGNDLLVSWKYANGNIVTEYMSAQIQGLNLTGSSFTDGTKFPIVNVKSISSSNDTFYAYKGNLVPGKLFQNYDTTSQPWMGFLNNDASVKLTGAITSFSAKTGVGIMTLVWRMNVTDLVQAMTHSIDNGQWVPSQSAAGRIDGIHGFSTPLVPVIYNGFWTNLTVMNSDLQTIGVNYLGCTTISARTPVDAQTICGTIKSTGLLYDYGISDNVQPLYWNNGRLGGDGPYASSYVPLPVDPSDGKAVASPMVEFCLEFPCSFTVDNLGYRAIVDW